MWWCLRTPLGRARAWLRLALMQKRLPDYFRLLVDNREELLLYVLYSFHFERITYMVSWSNFIDLFNLVLILFWQMMNGSFLISVETFLFLHFEVLSFSLWWCQSIEREIDLFCLIIFWRLIGETLIEPDWIKAEDPACLPSFLLTLPARAVENEFQHNWCIVRLSLRSCRFTTADQRSYHYSLSDWLPQSVNHSKDFGQQIVNSRPMWWIKPTCIAQRMA